MASLQEVMSLDVETTRDWVIIISGAMSILVLMAVFVFVVVLGLAARALLGATRNLLDNEVTPLISSARATVKTVRGTTNFIGETAANPVIKVYGIAAGVRRGLSVVSGLRGRGGDKPNE